MTKYWIPRAAAIVAFLVTSVTWAQSRDVREKKARKACLSGDWAKGVDILSDLFVETPDPNLIFNQGRCLEQSSRYADAISKFREYLRVGTTISAGDRASAEQHILDCEALLAKDGAAPTPRPQRTPTIAPPPALAQPAQPQPDAAVGAQATTAGTDALMAQPAAPRDAGAKLRVAGIVTAGVGVAGVVLGALFNVKANSIADDISLPNPFSRERDADRAGYETLGWVSYGVGGALFVTGGVLYYLGLRNRSAANVTVVPTVGAGMAGAFVEGSF